MYEKTYKRLETKDGAKDVFQKKKKDLGDLRCVKPKDGNVLVGEAKIKERLSRAWIMGMLGPGD